MIKFVSYHSYLFVIPPEPLVYEKDLDRFKQDLKNELLNGQCYATTRLTIFVGPLISPEQCVVLGQVLQEIGFNRSNIKVVELTQHECTL